MLHARHVCVQRAKEVEMLWQFWVGFELRYLAEPCNDRV